MPKTSETNAIKSMPKKGNEVSLVLTGESRLRSGKIRYSPLECKTVRRSSKTTEEKKMPATLKNCQVEIERVPEPKTETPGTSMNGGKIKRYKNDKSAKNVEVKVPQPSEDEAETEGNSEKANSLRNAEIGSGKLVKIDDIEVNAKEVKKEKEGNCEEAETEKSEKVHDKPVNMDDSEVNVNEVDKEKEGSCEEAKAEHNKIKEETYYEEESVDIAEEEEVETVIEVDIKGGNIKKEGDDEKRENGDVEIKKESTENKEEVFESEDKGTGNCSNEMMTEVDKSDGGSSVMILKQEKADSLLEENVILLSSSSDEKSNNDTQEAEDESSPRPLEFVEDEKIVLFGDQEDCESNALVIDEDRIDSPDFEVDVCDVECVLDLSNKDKEMPQQHQPMNLSFNTNQQENVNLDPWPPFRGNTSFAYSSCEAVSSVDNKVANNHQESYNSYSSTLWPVSPNAVRASLGFPQPLFCNYPLTTRPQGNLQNSTNLVTLYHMNLQPSHTVPNETTQNEVSSMDETSWENSRRVRVIRNPEEFALENTQEHPIILVVPKAIRLQPRIDMSHTCESPMVHSTVGSDNEEAAIQNDHQENHMQWSKLANRASVDEVTPYSAPTSSSDINNCGPFFNAKLYLPSLRMSEEDQPTYINENGTIDRSSRFLNFNSTEFSSATTSTAPKSFYGVVDSTSQQSTSSYEKPTTSFQPARFDQNRTKFVRQGKFAPQVPCSCGVPYCPGYEHKIQPSPMPPQSPTPTDSSSLNPLANSYTPNFYVSKSPSGDIRSNFYLRDTLDRRF